MNYQQAAIRAIKEWDRCRKSSLVKEIEKTAQFRTLKAYESSGSGDNITHVLFGLEFCSKDGDHYREVMVSVNYNPDTKAYFDDVRLYTIQDC
jgi:hypothetical protein